VSVLLVEDVYCNGRWPVFVAMAGGFNRLSSIKDKTYNIFKNTHVSCCNRRTAPTTHVVLHLSFLLLFNTLIVVVIIIDDAEKFEPQRQQR
jgi:hypothetical protein